MMNLFCSGMKLSPKITSQLNSENSVAKDLGAGEEIYREVMRNEAALHF